MSQVVLLSDNSYKPIRKARSFTLEYRTTFSGLGQGPGPRAGQLEGSILRLIHVGAIGVRVPCMVGAAPTFCKYVLSRLPGASSI